MTSIDSPHPPSLLRRPGCWITWITIIPLLIGGAYLAENWFGARELTRVQATLAAAGIELDSRRITLARPPEAENFCATPLLLAIGSGVDSGPELDAVRRITEWEERAKHAGTQFGEANSAKPTDWTALHQAIHEADPSAGLLEDEPDPVRALSELMERELAPVTTELVAAIDRPKAQFIPGYLEHSAQDLLLGGASRSMGSILRLAKAYKLRATLASAQGDGPKVVESCRLMLRLAAATEAEGPFICLLISNAMRQYLLQAVWTVTANRLLTKPSYEALAELLHDVRPLDTLPTTLEVEMCFGHSMHLSLRSDRARYLAMVLSEFSADPTSHWDPWEKSVLNLVPPGWFDANCAFSLEFSHRIWRRVQDPAVPDRFNVVAWMEHELSGTHHFPFHWKSAASMAVLGRPIQRVASIHATYRLAETACSLEAHYSDRQTYPETLDVLVPGYQPEVPIDLDGKPIRYRIDRANGRYILWSIGSDGIDEAGVEKSTDGSTPKSWIEPTGDWRWHYAN